MKKSIWFEKDLARTRPRKPASQRPAFTLVELVTVLAIIAILLAIAVPALSRAREASRDAQCKSNLREFGQAMTIYAEQHRNRLCSGAFDWRYDGGVTEIGWVADLVNMGTPVGEMLCPANPAKLSETYNDLIAMDPSVDQCAARLGGKDQTLPDGTVVVNPSRQLAALPAGAARLTAIEELIFNQGYNTNYAASWFLARSQTTLERWGALKGGAGCPPSLKSRSSTEGPLRLGRLNGSALVTSSNVPLLGCGKPGGMQGDSLPYDLGPHRAGMPLAGGMTGGPIRVDTLQPPAPANPTPYGGPTGWWTQWNNQTRQDYRNFGPVHGGSSKLSCNILFADGSVKSFLDENGDGLLNNGFDPTFVSPGLTLGYASDAIELPAANIYSLWSLNPKAGPGMQ